MRPYWERPCAAPGLTSYRYRARFGWVMIGARDEADALAEAARSTTEPVSRTQLERHNGVEYFAV